LSVLSRFDLSLLGVIVGLFDAYFWVIVIRALLSWFSPDPYHPIVRFLVAVTEPVLKPLRKLLPPHRLGGIDLSPLFAILILQFVRNGVIYSFGGRPRWAPF
jgi:YggT family protein